MSTLFSDVNKLFFDKIQKDADFFMYNNVTLQNALTIAETRAEGYLIESIAKLVLSCTPTIDFTDFDLAITNIPAHFNIDLTFIEMDILSSLMYEMYFNKDMVLLKALANNLSPKDLNVFSPANERKTFLEMLIFIKKENMKMIKNYMARDRLTSELKQIDYASYNEV